ncbi:MAG: dNTP triphosphohydrolase [Succinivibrio sp.]|nr:dNTP triphosphohydrolase [Succinivibrio sp.]
MSESNLADRLFCAKRIRGDLVSSDPLLGEFTALDGEDYGLELDRLKTTLTSPVRRLQQKTQVFPLDVQASSRSRLTHSLETKAYARVLGMAIARRRLELRLHTGNMLLCLGSAAMLHDVGNPPFGHFGEHVLRSWLTEVVDRQELRYLLREYEVEDLKAFNGNAQGIRQLHTIQDLNLTLGQIAAIIKVPYTITELLQGKWRGMGGITGNFPAWAHAHAGVFLSEKSLLDEIRTARHTSNRHPFSSIIECADDLAYTLADLEDAFDRGVIDRYSVLQLCEIICSIPELNSFHELLSVHKVRDLFLQSPSEALPYLRSVISKAYISDVADTAATEFRRFIETGEIDFTRGEHQGLTLIQLLKDYELKHVYSHESVEGLELTGGGYLRGLLKIFMRLLFEEPDQFRLELTGRGGEPWLRRLARRISRRHREAYLQATSEGQLSEMYLRIRLIVDYISGMTDTYAAAEYRLLCGDAAAGV